MLPPRATYRLQFHEHFRLADALALVPYLNALGISHLYASPLFKAAPHSTHGYDVCDFRQLNPELGTEADLARLVAALHARKMGLVLDIVPNHMGIGTRENVWWWDVLTHGQKSPFAEHFDIEWRSPDKSRNEKVLVPVLGDAYETLLNKGELQLCREGRTLLLAYHEHRFPLAPETVANVRGADQLQKFNQDISALNDLICRQNYRLEYHALGDANLNYRRFFAVSSLAALRVEDAKVFASSHACLRRWLKRGWLDGLRVDHPDGLRDPQKYLARLRALAPKAWIVVEKILQADESLPASWPVAGTTGYDFLIQLNSLFVDPASEKSLTDFYAEFTHEPTDYFALGRENKRECLTTLLAAELRRLASLLLTIAARRGILPQFSDAELSAALTEILVCFPIYRSYISENNGGSSADHAAITFAVHLACEQRSELAAGAFAFIQSLLLKPQRGKLARQFIARFQQLTVSVMAKGIEDTAFYRFNRFTSLNEVGGAPNQFGIGMDAFHEAMRRRQADWPHSQLTTSTHDTKRAEDVRARLNVLSEIPELWMQTVRRWSALTARHRQNDLPDRNTEYFFYQTLAGAWPLSIERAQAYMDKSVRESKRHTSWTNKNDDYETALKKFIAASLADPAFTADVGNFIGSINDAAAVNSLAQTLIKLTAPGVPDIYQGGELWDFSLVDPDNRRPVDFRARRKYLAEIKKLSPEEIWRLRAEGLPKLWLVYKTLNLRKQFLEFSKFNYEPLCARGEKSEHVFAFARGGRLITVVPRFNLQLNHEWQDTSLALPAGTWRNAFTGEIYREAILPGKLFSSFPVALLVRKEID